MKLLGIGSDLGTGKVTGILKNKVEISYQDGTIEFISFKEAERRVYIYSLQGWKSVYFFSFLRSVCYAKAN